MRERWSVVTLRIIRSLGEQRLHQGISSFRQRHGPQVESIVTKPAQDVQTAGRCVQAHAVGQSTIPERVVRQHQCH